MSRLDNTGWIQTISGKAFFFEDPRPEDIDIGDIAWALSMQCRYNGHVRDFYSVAEHSVLVSQIVPWEFALEGLLHDASEAVMGDLVRPLKQLMPAFAEMEAKIEEVIAKKYGLIYPWPKEVKEADNILLMTERRDLIPIKQEWTKWAEPMEGTIVAVDSTTARDLFLTRFASLMVDRAINDARLVRSPAK